MPPQIGSCWERAVWAAGTLNCFTSRLPPHFGQDTLSSALRTRASNVL
jgi:hypothetical protein